MKYGANSLHYSSSNGQSELFRYAFYFGVDTSRNGRLDWDVLHYAWVILNVVQ